MTETLTVTVNEQSQEVPNAVETLSGFLEAVGFEADVDHRDAAEVYDVVRFDTCPHCGHDEEVELTSGMFVFDDGDEFWVVPRYVGGGG